MRALAGLALLSAAMAATPAEAAGRGAGKCPWNAAWASSQMTPAGENAHPPGALAGATLRQVVRVSTGGTALRVRVSNVFGRTPLRISGASLARSANNRTGDIVVESLKPLNFAGRPDVVIPPGGEWLSDPIAGPVPAFADLAVSLRLEAEPDGQTGHPGSRATSYIAPGNALSAESLSGATTLDRWYHLSGIEVQGCSKPEGVVVLGDSITDGRGSTTNGNDRWTDVLARRLGGKRAVINQGIGGNRVLLDGLGPNALARLDRDVLAQPNVGHLIVLEGINDIGNVSRDPVSTQASYDALVSELTGAYAQIVARSHARGIRVYGATILPFATNEYYRPGPMAEAARQAVNAWIRSKGNFDAVIDLDAAIRDPERPDRLAPAYDTGDGLHPNPAGFNAMAKAVPLSLFD